MPVKDVFSVEGVDLKVWPDGQEARSFDEKGLVLRTDFADAKLLEAQLRQEIETRLADPADSGRYTAAVRVSSRGCSSAAKRASPDLE